MDERTNFNNGYKPTPAQDTDIYSSSHTPVPPYVPMTETQAAEHYGDAFVKGDTAEIEPQTPSYQEPSGYSYAHYQSQFTSQAAHAARPQPDKTQKKSRKGRRTAMIACSLALALCLGFGGGVLGAYIMQSPQTSADKTITATASGQVVTAATAEGKESDLKIVESNAVKSGTSSNSIKDVVSRVKDTVVEITTEATSYSSFYGQYVTQGAGSGVIISADGYIITNNHVIDGATQVTVTTSDNKNYEAKVIGTDDTYDVALLKIDAEGLTVATFGSSSDLEVGETSIVIGNPLGKLGGTVTAGIISSLNRTITIENKSMELLQTDAPINPGNSGGGLFDGDGNLVGIVVAKSVQTSDGTNVESIGFAIPIDNVKSILGDLKDKGYVSGRAALGLTSVNVLTDSAARRYGVEQKGVYVYSLVEGGAAEKAGIVVGDLIKKFDGTEITGNDQLSALVLQKKAGDKVDVVVYRDGEEKTISVTLDERNSNNTNNSRNSNGFNANGGSDGSNGSSDRGYYGYGGLDDFFNDFGF